MIKLFNGNNLEIMEQLINEGIRVDLTVTSPPYDKLRTYEDTCLWNFETFKQTAEKLFKITKDNGVLVWVVNDMIINGYESLSSFNQAIYFKEIGFNLHDTMIWEKDSCSFPDKTRYAQCFEYMFVFTKGKLSKINKIKDKKNKYAGTKIHGTSRKPSGEIFRKSNHNKTTTQEYGERSNIWHIPSEKKNKSNHPAPYPIQIAKDHIISWTNEGDLVFDPFMGSGTTGVACKEENRNFIGIEIVTKYFDYAKNRISTTQEKLFH